MILAFTGAGISKASGIPTFEDQGDMRLKLNRGYYRMHKDEVDGIIDTMLETCLKAEPNDAHKALAEYNIPVLTMNIDGLHREAGTKNLVELHGVLPNIVLYGDPAPEYSTAFNYVSMLKPGDTFLIIGVSFFTLISDQLRIYAMSQGANIEIINEDAEHKVRLFLENNLKTS